MTDLDGLRARPLPMVGGKPDVRWEGSWLRPGDRVKSERWDDLGTVTNDWEQWERGLLGVAVVWDVGDRPGVGSLLDWQGRLSLVEPAPDEAQRTKKNTVTVTVDVDTSPFMEKMAEVQRVARKFDESWDRLIEVWSARSDDLRRGLEAIAEQKRPTPPGPLAHPHGDHPGNDGGEPEFVGTSRVADVNEAYGPWDATNVESGSVSVNEIGDPLTVEQREGNLDIGGGDVKVESSTLELPTVEAIAEGIADSYAEQYPSHLSSAARSFGYWSGAEQRWFTRAVEQVVGPLLGRLAEAEGARDMAFAQIAEDGLRIAELEQWKREATEVLAEWDAIYDSVAEESSDWGRTRASVVAQRLVESERQCWEMATRAGDRDRRITELEAENDRLSRPRRQSSKWVCAVHGGTFESERGCPDSITRCGHWTGGYPCQWVGLSPFSAAEEAEQPEWTDAWRFHNADFPFAGLRQTPVDDPDAAKFWDPVQVAIRPRPDNA